MARPLIIISQTIVAAAARRWSSTRLASNTNTDVPDALTPRPIRVKATKAKSAPSMPWLAMSVVAVAAITPPVARTAIPPRIHGVQRPSMSEP